MQDMSTMTNEAHLLNFNQSIRFLSHSERGVFRPRSLGELVDKIKSLGMLETSKQKRVHVLGERCSFQFPQTHPLNIRIVPNRASGTVDLYHHLRSAY